MLYGFLKINLPSCPSCSKSHPSPSYHLLLLKTLMFMKQTNHCMHLYYMFQVFILCLGMILVRRISPNSPLTPSQLPSPKLCPCSPTLWKSQILTNFLYLFWGCSICHFFQIFSRAAPASRLSLAPVYKAHVNQTVERQNSSISKLH